MRVRVVFLLAVASALLVLSTDCSRTTEYLVCSARNANFAPSSAARSDSECRSCLADRCCLELGRCQPQDLPNFSQEDTDAAAPCFSRASRLFECAAEAGSVEDPACRARVGVPPGSDEERLLTCASRACPSCGVPAPCALDPSVPAIVNGACDGCVAGRCCHVIQECYASRSCKLAFECLIAEKNADGSCVDALVGAAGGLAKGGLASLEAVACAVDAAAGPVALPNEAPACVRKCVDAFSPDRCLALRVLSCIEGAGCLPLCASRAGGADAGADGSTDAGAGADTGSSPSDAATD